MIRFLSLILVTLSSTAALASGFICDGGGYRVKLFNEVRPELGTQNPAVLIVSSEGVGTIARIVEANITKEYEEGDVVYSGHTNHYSNGRFVSVRVAINKQVDSLGYHQAKLELNADNGNWTAPLTCTEYVKGDLE